MKKHRILYGLLFILTIYILISYIFLTYVIYGDFNRITYVGNYTSAFTTSSQDKMKIKTFQKLMKNGFLIPILFYISPQYKFDDFNIKYNISLNGTINSAVSLPVYGNCIKINGLKYLMINTKNKNSLYDLFYKLPPDTPQKLSNLIGKKINKMDLYFENKLSFGNKTYAIKDASIKKFFNYFGNLQFKSLQKKYIPKRGETFFTITFYSYDANKKLDIMHIIKIDNGYYATYNDMYLSCGNISDDEIIKMLDFFGVKDKLKI